MINGLKHGNATITVTYKVGEKDCGNDDKKTILVTVICPTIEITPSDITGDCTGGTVTFSHNP